MCFYFRPAAVGELAGKMLGFNLTTKQTPKEGVKVKTVRRKAPCLSLA